MSINKINGPDPYGGPDKLGNGKDQPGKTDSREHAPVGDRSDRVEVSPAAREAAHLARSARALPDIRAQLVAQYRADIEADRYQVDPREVATAFVEFEYELFR